MGGLEEFPQIHGKIWKGSRILVWLPRFGTGIEVNIVGSP